MRTIIHSKTKGVYLGSTFGGAFFSFVPTIFTHGTTFVDESEAREFVRHNESDDEFPQDVDFLQVNTDAAQASMAECVEAGVAQWDTCRTDLAKFSFGHRIIMGTDGVMSITKLDEIRNTRL